MALPGSCPRCGKGQLDVRDSRSATSGAFLIVRRRVCNECGHRVWTSEVITAHNVKSVERGSLVKLVQARKLLNEYLDAVATK